jgi:hypothetical protein
LKKIFEEIFKKFFQEIFDKFSKNFRVLHKKKQKKQKQKAIIYLKTTFAIGIQEMNFGGHRSSHQMKRHIT